MKTVDYSLNLQYNVFFEGVVMIEQLITDYKNFNVENTKAIKKSENLQFEYTKIMEDATKEFNSYSFFKRLFPNQKRKEIIKLKEVIDSEKRISNNLHEKDQINRKALFDECVNQLIYSNESNKIEYVKITDRILKINDAYNIINNTVQAGNAALSEIDEAISSVGSAETSETLDLISSNKAFSFMSSMDASSARTETNEAVEAVNKFKKQLAFANVKIKDLKFNDSWMTLDFIFDMAESGGFMDAFSSFMALQSLGDTKQKLYETKEKVSNVLNPIKEDLAEIRKQKGEEETILNNFMENFRIQIKVTLTQNGISI